MGEDLEASDLGTCLGVERGVPRDSILLREVHSGHAPGVHSILAVEGYISSPSQNYGCYFPHPRQLR